MKTNKDYLDRVKEMRTGMVQWQKDHPTETALIKINEDKRITVIGSIEDGITSKVIQANAEAVRMLTDLKLIGKDSDHPTVLMLKFAMEEEVVFNAVNEGNLLGHLFAP